MISIESKYTTRVVFTGQYVKNLKLELLHFIWVLSVVLSRPPES